MKEILIEIDYDVTYKKLLKVLKPEKGFRFLEENAGRIFFIKESSNNSLELFRLAKNNLGLEINKKEVEIAKLEDSFPDIRCVYDNNYLLINTSLSNTSNYVDLNSIIKTSGESTEEERAKILLKILEYQYFLKENKWEKRVSKEHKIRSLKELHKFEAHLNVLSLNFSNKVLQKLIDITHKYNLEPADLLRYSFKERSKNKIKLLNFGLTEDIYFNNMKRIHIEGNDLRLSTFFIKSFSGEWILDNVASKKLNEIGYESAEDFYYQNYGEKIDFSDNSIYGKNNSFIKIDK